MALAEIPSGVARVRFSPVFFQEAKDWKNARNRYRVIHIGPLGKRNKGRFQPKHL
jgi:hypothetical protein